MALSQYQQGTADWREQLRRNQRKTKQVIIAFILLYLTLGVLIDVMWYSHLYNASASLVLHALLQLHLFPFGTLTMIGVAVISLLITYALYDRVMLLGTEYHEVTADNTTELPEQQLYHVVEEMKVAAGLRYMPRVFIIEADYMNAFASGYSEKSAMVAITRGLMQKLNRRELQAVMAHELSHIRHLDIKLTLMVAVLSNIMLIVIDILFYAAIFGRRRRGDNRILMFIMILRYVLPIITVLLGLYLSRTREYMADAGCVELMRDNEPLASALLKIHQDHQDNRDTYRQAYGQTAHEEVRRASYLYDPMKAGLQPVKGLDSAFSTHPALNDRLKALGFEQR